MTVTKHESYFSIEHKGASYNIRVDQTNIETILKAAEFLTGETGDFISTDTIEELINDYQT